MVRSDVGSIYNIQKSFNKLNILTFRTDPMLIAYLFIITLNTIFRNSMKTLKQLTQNSFQQSGRIQEEFIFNSCQKYFILNL